MALSSKISPFLWFPDPLALEAAEFYVSLFNDSPNPHRAKSTIGTKTTYTKSSEEILESKNVTPHPPPGSIMSVDFTLCGQDFKALNGPNVPDKPQNSLFPFNEAISFWIDCENQEEVDYFWDRLTKGGKEIECGWCKDKYGVCWQVVPSRLSELTDAEGVETKVKEKVTAAMLGMKKLDIQGFEDAAKEAREGN